ncbi:MAG: hypothetical protein JXR96_25095 [Deltaproteobacteria bacterium]|nr:hypothetical protein [Deltaproteobacteria bacterium]
MSPKPSLEIDPSLSPCPARPALIWATGISPPLQSEALPGFLASEVERAAAQGEALWAEGMRARVRDMLRHGRYKPAGRGRPASEFLLRAAEQGQFPAVNPPVDVNNAVSLASGLPGSIFDAALSGTELLLRRGRPGERYVFNPSGQVIELQDLLLVCGRREGDWLPCGNPVKDSAATKIHPGTRDVVAVLYAPASETEEELSRWARRFADLLASHCHARESGFELVGVDP